MGMTVNFQWNTPPAAIVARIINNDVKVFAASEWRRLIEPFVPRENGDLRSNSRPLAEGGMGVIHYTSPYAHYQYTGLAMAGSAPKHYTGKALRYKTAGTGARWDQIAKNNGRVAPLCSAIEGYLGR